MVCPIIFDGILVCWPILDRRIRKGAYIDWAIRTISTDALVISRNLPPFDLGNSPNTDNTPLVLVHDRRYITLIC